MKIAVIENTVVVNIIKGGQPIIDEDPDKYVNTIGHTVDIGYTYDGLVFTPGVLPQLPVKYVSKLDFLDRFLFNELSDIMLKTKSDSEVAVIIEYFHATVDYINLSSQRVDTHLTMLVSKGVLTEQRKTEIISGA